MRKVTSFIQGPNAEAVSIEVRSISLTLYKINSKYVSDPHVKPEVLEVLQEIKQNTSDYRLGRDCLK